jgi:hypothetical protein
MLNRAAAPPPLHPTSMGPEIPDQRAADLDGIVSLPVRNLFEDIPQEIYAIGGDVSEIRRATKEALSRVDMSMIKPKDTVNLLCSEHGFAIMGGDPYAEMVKAIKDAVEEQTGCNNIRLRYAGGEGLKESRHIIPHYGLDKAFDRIVATGPFDKGMAIETDIGTLYGLKRIYDADWFIHTCYSDPREIYFHRAINRILKTFCMAYARFETRSAYHMNFSSRSSNVIPRAIFDSPFVQEKFAFVCVMETSPAGVVCVRADTDLYEIDRIITQNILASYGKMIRLFAEIDECVVVLDGMRWPWYIHGGGLVAGTLFKAPLDYLNLDISGRKPEDPHLNPAVKALVVNYAWRNAFIGLIHIYPTFIAGKKTAQGLTRAMAKYGTVTEDLKTAIQKAYETAKTDKAIVFDGCYGDINLSPSMGDFLLKQAPMVAEKVDHELLPLWLAQRGLTSR